MSGAYIRIPTSGSATWKDPVANSAALPMTGNSNGDARVTLDDSSIYIWDGAAWNQVSGGGGGGDSFYIMQTPLGTSPTATSATDILTWASDGTVDITGNAATDTITLGITALSITNALVSNSAAIAYSKLNLSNSIVNADVSGSAAISYSKLSLNDSIVNADINSAAAIAYSKLNLANSIVNADVSSSAALALSKLATLTGSRAVETSVGGVLQASAVTSTELALLSGKTALGDVSGPASSVDNALVRFDGTTGKVIQSPPTGTTLDDTGYLTLPSAGGVQFGSANDGIRLNTGSMEFWLNSGARTSRFSIHDTTPHAGITVGPSSTGRVYLGAQNVAANNYIGGQTGSQFGGAGSMSVFAGNNTNTTTANLAGDLFLYAGNHASNNAAARGGDASLTAGNQTNASGVARAGDLTLGAGNATGSGAGGIAVIQGGTSGTGAQGYVQIGRASSTNVNRLNNALGTAGSDVLTLNNGPTGTAGDPDGYLRININGTDRYIPFWNV